jgi:hypothetical protein
VHFARQPRFGAEAQRLARDAGRSTTAMRERLLTALAGMGALTTRPLTELDWHRLLDAAILTVRS